MVKISFVKATTHKLRCFCAAGQVGLELADKVPGVLFYKKKEKKKITNNGEFDPGSG